MIHIDKSNISVFIPVYDRYKQNCDGKYIIILQHIASKDVWVISAEDRFYFARTTSNRILLQVDLGCHFEHGTYDLFVIPYDSYIRPEVLHINDVTASPKTDKGGLTFDDSFLLTQDGILVTGWQKTRWHYLNIESDTESLDTRLTGDYCERLCVLGRDLLVYNDSCSCDLFEYDNKEKKIIEYNG